MAGATVLHKVPAEREGLVGKREVPGLRPACVTPCGLGAAASECPPSEQENLLWVTYCGGSKKEQAAQNGGLFGVRWHRHCQVSLLKSNGSYTRLRTTFCFMKAAWPVLLF